MRQEPEFAIGLPGVEPEGSRIPWSLVVLHLLAAVAGFVGPLYYYASCLPHGCRAPLTACKSNCKNIATALEMYASDNGGRYPATLQQLLPGNYLGKLPTCPEARRMNYTNYRSCQTPDSFSFTCVGNNHAKAYTGFTTSSANFPQYSAESGLLDHP